MAAAAAAAAGLPGYTAWPGEDGVEGGAAPGDGGGVVGVGTPLFVMTGVHFGTGPVEGPAAAAAAAIVAEIASKEEEDDEL